MCAKRRQKRLTLIVTVSAFCGIALLVYLFSFRETVAPSQRKAVSALRKLPHEFEIELNEKSEVVKVVVRWATGIKYIFAGRLPPITDAVCDRLKDISTIRELEFPHSTEITDSGLAMLNRLDNLEVLKLGRSKLITDAALIHLSQCPNLKELHLSECVGITNEGLRHLQEFAHLQKLSIKLMALQGKSKTIDYIGLLHLRQLRGLHELNLFLAYPSHSVPTFTLSGRRYFLCRLKQALPDCKFVGVDDADFVLPNEVILAFESDNEAALLAPELMGLNRLRLNCTQLTDNGLASLAAIHDVDSLELLLSRNSRITDAGLVHLKPLANLHALDLYLTNIGDSGVEHLKGLTQLRRLQLRETRVTDAGLRHLHELTSLESVDLTSTAVTRVGLVGLSQALPDCQVFTGGRAP